MLDIGKWSLANGRIPHKSLPHAGRRISIVPFTHSSAASRNSSSAIAAAAEAGFPVPACPASGTPSIEDLRFINKGMQAAVTAFRRMCESTITVATDTMLPSCIPPESATWNGAHHFMASRPFHFLHRSLLLCMLYASLIFGAVTTAEASVDYYNIDSHCALEGFSRVASPTSGRTTQSGHLTTRSCSGMAAVWQRSGNEEVLASGAGTSYTFSGNASGTSAATLSNGAASCTYGADLRSDCLSIPGSGSSGGLFVWEGDGGRNTLQRQQQHRSSVHIQPDVYTDDWQQQQQQQRYQKSDVCDFDLDFGPVVCPFGKRPCA